MQEVEEESETRVPLLHRIPILGWLFKYTSHTKVKTNLLVFLTPHIIKTGEDLDRIAQAKAATFARNEQIYPEGELLVEFHAGVPDDLALAVITSKEAQVIEPLGDGRFRILLSPEMNVDEGIEEFSEVPEIRLAEPNYRLKYMQ
jgi:Flp pilus assembly secretin CpaC